MYEDMEAHFSGKQTQGDSWNLIYNNYTLEIKAPQWRGLLTEL